MSFFSSVRSKENTALWLAMCCRLLPFWRYHSSWLPILQTLCQWKMEKLILQRWTGPFWPACRAMFLAQCSPVRLTLCSWMYHSCSHYNYDRRPDYYSDNRFFDKRYRCNWSGTRRRHARPLRSHREHQLRQIPLLLWPLSQVWNKWL